MRPHRHPHKWEFLVILAGELDLLIFDDHGHILQRNTVAPSATRAVEVPPGCWHAYVCKLPSTLALEVKQGSYIPTLAEDFAFWSPVEGVNGVRDYLQWMRIGAVSSCGRV